MRRIKQVKRNLYRFKGVEISIHEKCLTNIETPPEGEEFLVKCNGCPLPRKQVEHLNFRILVRKTSKPNPIFLQSKMIAREFIGIIGPNSIEAIEEIINNQSQIFNQG